MTFDESLDILQTYAGKTNIDEQTEISIINALCDSCKITNNDMVGDSCPGDGAICDRISDYFEGGIF